jgi:folate-dependent phosphoribosylglycinamide formyltransferase PurN
VILQESVPIHMGDTPETLAKRVLDAEHRIYPRALALVASGQVTADAIASG